MKSGTYLARSSTEVESIVDKQLVENKFSFPDVHVFYLYQQRIKILQIVHCQPDFFLVTLKTYNHQIYYSSLLDCHTLLLESDFVARKVYTVSEVKATDFFGEIVRTKHEAFGNLKQISHHIWYLILWFSSTENSNIKHYFFKHENVNLKLGESNVPSSFTLFTKISIEN